MRNHSIVEPDRNYTPQVAASWLIVGLPLGYGIFNAVKAALQLFSG